MSEFGSDAYFMRIIQPYLARLISTLEHGMARNVSEWDHEYYSAYASGKHFLWGTEPEAFVKGVVDNILIKQKRSKNELRVLDLGCGEGRHCMYLSCHELQVVGLDVSRVALHKGLELKYKSEIRFELVLGDCHRLPFIEGAFDYLLDVYTMEFVREKENYVKEISKILKVGGSLFAIESREKTGKEPHSVDQIMLERGLKDAGMAVIKVRVSEHDLRIELEACKR